MNRLFPALLRLAAFLFVAGLILAGPAFAEDGRVALGPVSVFVQPYLSVLAEVAITALLGFLATRLSAWTGITIEASHREALHSAAMTGVNLALSRLDVSMSGVSVDVRSAVVADAVAWVLRSVPDALKHLNVTPEKVRAIVEAKLHDAIRERQSAVATHTFVPSAGG